MQNYKDPDGKLWALDSEDDPPKWLPDGCVAIPQAEADAITAAANQPSPADAIRIQILDLEKEQSNRRIREAVLNIGNSRAFLADIETQIEALRAKLSGL